MGGRHQPEPGLLCHGGEAMIGDPPFQWGSQDQLCILDFPYDKVAVRLSKQRAMMLADEIDRHFRRVRPPPDWNGKWFVCFVIDGERRYALYPNRQEAERSLEEIRTAFDRGGSWRGLLHTTAQVTADPVDTVVFARSVSRMYMKEADEE